MAALVLRRLQGKVEVRKKKRWYRDAYTPRIAKLDDNTARHNAIPPGNGFDLIPKWAAVSR